MNLKKPCVLLGLLASLYAASCGGDETASQSSTGTVAPVENACPKACEVSGKLDCAGDVNQACSSCEPFRTSVPWCEPQANTYWSCVASDEANFVCGGGNAGVLWAKEVVCIPEVHAFALCSCMAEGVGTMPDRKAVCAAYCGKQAGLPCASATCEQDCMIDTFPKRFRGPAMMALYACVAEDADSGFACTVGGLLLPKFSDACSSKTSNANTCNGIEKIGCVGQCAAECADTMCKGAPLAISDPCRECILKQPPTL